MKIVNFLILILSLSVNLFAGSVTTTYTAGAIPTTYIASASIDTSSRAINPGLLTVTVPVGVPITEVDVVYNMTANSLGYMSEQRSFIRCISPGGATEPQVSSGVGNKAGTYSYNRSSSIANNVASGGSIQFELHAFRVYGGSGSDTIYSYVNNNSWQVTVIYEIVDNPTNIVATAYTTQILLNWTSNVANDAATIAYNTTNSFGTLTNGTWYYIDSTLSGGGTILKSYTAPPIYHLFLNPGTKYYYKIWSRSNYNNYSHGVEFNATTSLVNTAPVVSNVTFVNNISTTGYVDIYYDVMDAEQTQLKINLEVSNDGGATFNFPSTQLAGDTGTGVSIGNSKHILWNFAREHSGVSGNNFKIKIIADDLVGDQIYYGGKIYNTVTIASQTWLSENLDIGSQINGSINQTKGTKWCYQDDTANCRIYGGLYQWGVAQGVCPAGWRILSQGDFSETLGRAVNWDGNKLKAVGQGISPGAGTNMSGFSALLAGCGNSGGYNYLGYGAYFWTSESNSSSAKYYAYLNYNSGDMYWAETMSYQVGMSVRCVHK